MGLAAVARRGVLVRREPSDLAGVYVLLVFVFIGGLVYLVDGSWTHKPLALVAMVFSVGFAYLIRPRAGDR